MTTPTPAAKPALTPQAKRALKTVFVTIFLDLIGFSIIFPLFPALAKHYLSTDAGDPILRFVFSTIEHMAAVGGAVSDAQKIVLFGGILGAFYSLLQFMCAPMWGALSDRIGRKPVLVMTIGGMAFSYVLWIVSGSFTLLVIARVVGGIMSGNISTATACVSDVTEQNTRSRGMAIIGIAFGLGFIFGPALGGMASLWNLANTHPEWVAYGINPFSGAAVIACVLSLLNLLQVIRNFQETLPPEKRGLHTEAARSSNPIKLFKPFPYPGVNRTNVGYFLFLTAFSGMEFTLTFLAAERFNYTPKQNASMFVFVGLLIALVQGGLVRRKAHDVGEKKFTLMGLAAVLPGLVLIGLAQTQGMLYAGLAFLAFGSACIVPCMTSLTTMYAPANIQGQVVGVFRSLGALARVVGPFTASIVYWRFGSTVPYFAGAAFLLLPMGLIAALPVVELTQPV
jgi:MFS family permease